MKVYFFTDGDINDDEIYFIIYNLNKKPPYQGLSYLPPSPRVEPISHDEIYNLAKFLNMSVGSIQKLFKDLL